jgi:para-aminobenzoate synthetase component I
MRPVARHTFASKLASHPICERTPAEIFTHLHTFDDCFWLDSGAESKGWSYFGTNPVERIVVPRMDASDRSFIPAIRKIRSSGALTRTRTVHQDQEGPPFRGGWVGYSGYPDRNFGRTNEVQLPRIGAALFDVVLAYAHAKREWWVTGFETEDQLTVGVRNLIRSKIERLLEHFAPGCRSLLDLASPAKRHCTASVSREEFKRRVSFAKEYIAAGDIYQLNLSQRLSVPWRDSAAELYFRMRQQSPASYGAYLGRNVLDGHHALCSLSPELFLRVRGDQVVTCPIKGTRPRSTDAVQDEAARRDLESNAKERAELNMIVDLERNDLGRVCKYGSVRVDHPGEVQQLPTLYHRIASVSGTLREDVDTIALLRAMFPGGSITGAPKIRAMQLIAELEPHERGPYCGAIGWLGCNGDLDLNIAIRTAVHDAVTGTASYHAGSGIVADSDPDAEYEETLHKAAAFLRAVNAT